MRLQLSSAALAALLLYSCADKPTEQSAGNRDEAELMTLPEGQATTEPTTTSASSDLTITKADTGKARGLVFLVKNINEPPINPRLVTAPEEGEKYIAVQIWVRNVSDADIDLEREDFKLFDQNDAEFVEKTGFVEHRKSPIMFKSDYEVMTLKPNQAASGWVTFTTDKESKAKKVAFENVTVTL